jgi:hypothetical protein
MLWQILVTTIFGLTDAWWQCDGLGPWGNADRRSKQLGPRPSPEANMGKAHTDLFAQKRLGWFHAIKCYVYIYIVIFIYLLTYSVIFIYSFHVYTYKWYIINFVTPVPPNFMATPPHCRSGSSNDQRWCACCHHRSLPSGCVFCMCLSILSVWCI